MNLKFWNFEILKLLMKSKNWTNGKDDKSSHGYPNFLMKDPKMTMSLYYDYKVAPLQTLL